MAKDDYHVIVYQILAYLYKCLKEGKEVDSKMLSRNSPYFIVDGHALSERYWSFILFNLQEMGLVSGILFAERVNNYPFDRPLEWDECMITPKGIEYLTDNSFLKKVEKFLKDAKEIVPFV